MQSERAAPVAGQRPYSRPNPNSQFQECRLPTAQTLPVSPTGSSAFPIGSSKQITTFSPQPKGSGKASLKYGKSENRRGVSNLTGLLPAQEDFTADAIDLGFAPLFLGCFYRRHRFANAAVRIVELAEFRIGPRQA
jgi:hypothetical protein